MITTWQNILDQQQTLETQQTPLKHPSYMPLPQFGILQVSGTDAPLFLQNLLTNDVNALDINQSQLSGFCNVKGRLLAVFLLIRQQHNYQIVLPKDICASLQQRLTMFILRSKVSITDESDNIACIGLNRLDMQANDNEPNSFAITPYLQQQRAIALITSSQTSDFLAIAKQHKWQLVSEKSWNLLDIESGIPMVFIASKEKFTPQQINLDLVGGVSFSKGCYPGQEVVARLHYLGKPSRRLFKAETITKQEPNIGDEVFTSTKEVAGHIVCAQRLKASVQLLLSLKLTTVNSHLYINGETVSLLDSVME